MHKKDLLLRAANTIALAGLPTVALAICSSVLLVLSQWSGWFRSWSKLPWRCLLDCDFYSQFSIVGAPPICTRTPKVQGRESLERFTHCRPRSTASRSVEMGPRRPLPPQLQFRMQMMG